ncbi:MAG TPA: hypothetical protein ENH55_13220 [Aurantimonas coralicida]|uniref:Uncharacterized protein n=2 Tax=root TaxID=1 RepID=A0A9C9NE81_9HYPH|nr:hypothetical protein [Aurantimonas coralicida]HET99679.1 hypothetical protein [Aurantimonas coralicida]
MTPLTRRMALRAFAAAFVSAPVVAEAQKRAMVLAPGISNEGIEPPSSDNERLTFTDYASWFSRVGHAEITRQASYIHGFDGDIIDFHLPMVTKVRMQRARNYERILAERKRWFVKKIGLKGFVNWWE